MLNDSDYYKDGVTRVIELLKDTFGDQFRFYYNGEPDAIGVSAMPCIVVTNLSTNFESGATGTDDITENVMIKMVLNKKSYLDPNAGATDKAEVTLRRLVYGMSPTTQQYLPGTLMYALRTNITLSDAIIQNVGSTEFGVIEQPDDVITIEAWTEIVLTRLALVPSRT